jgi:integrase
VSYLCGDHTPPDARSPPYRDRGLPARRTGNLKLAQMLAGHADIGTTANIYAHLDTTDLETALRALNEVPR